MKNTITKLFVFTLILFLTFGCNHKNKLLDTVPNKSTDPETEIDEPEIEPEPGLPDMFVYIAGQKKSVKNSQVYFEFDESIDYIRTDDIKVSVKDSQEKISVKMSPNVIVLKNTPAVFTICELEGAEFKFNITVTVKYKTLENSYHNGDLQIWVPLCSTDKNEALQALPSDKNAGDYIVEVNYNFEEYDLPQIWVLYKPQPTGKVKSKDLRFSEIADGEKPLLLYLQFPAQGSELEIPLYIDLGTTTKQYNLIVRTKKAPETENANIKSVTFNGIPGVIEGKNITCNSVFEINSTVAVDVVLENTEAACVINSGSPVLITKNGCSFEITVTPKKADGIRKRYNVVLDAPPNNAILKVLHLNVNSNINEQPKLSDLLPADIEIDGYTRSITVPLYTVAENVVFSFENAAGFEIKSCFYLKKNRWAKLLESYSSATKMLTLREGILPLPPSTQNQLKLKIVFKDDSYDILTVKFKKPSELQPLTIMGLYLNDKEIESEKIKTFFDGTNPLYEAKGPSIFVSLITKEAVSTLVNGVTYSSVYSGFLSYELNFPVLMPAENEQKDIQVPIECEYAQNVNLIFKAKRIPGAVDLILYPVINGLNIGSDFLSKFTTGENPTVVIEGDKMLLTVDTKQTELGTMTVNDENGEIKTLTDAKTGEKFFRAQFLLEGFALGEERKIVVVIKPKDISQYNDVRWEFKVKREL